MEVVPAPGIMLLVRLGVQSVVVAIVELMAAELEIEGSVGYGRGRGGAGMGIAIDCGLTAPS